MRASGDNDGSTPRHILYGIPFVCVFSLILLSFGADFGHVGGHKPYKPRMAVSAPSDCSKGDLGCTLHKDFPSVEWTYTTLAGNPRVVVNVQAVPNFMMIVLPPKTDPGLSTTVARSGMHDSHVAYLMYRILGDRGESCRAAPGERHAPLVVDVGASLGTFTLIAASIGCRVLAFEAQPQLVTAMEASLALNEFGHLAEVVNMAVADDATHYVVPATSTGDVAAFTLEGRDEEEPDVALEAKRGNAVVESTRLDHVGMDGDVLLLKIDVGGDEDNAIRSAHGLLKAGKVHNLVVDIQTPPGPDAVPNPGGWLEVIEGLYAYGYHARVVTRTGNSPVPPEAPSGRLVLSRDLRPDDFDGLVEAFAAKGGHELLDGRSTRDGVLTLWFYKVRDPGHRHGHYP
mmetsp:Transcript_21105/g.66840  ORF Transcript_21105/g.66840 Transcript_21105/m.66840 type:complete len:400 (-) Transcript_21105:98-1297(-)